MLVLRPLKNNKLELAWQGPYEVVDRMNEVDYVVRAERGRKLYHANLLKKYVERLKHLQPQAAHLEAKADAMTTSFWNTPGYHLATVMWHDQPSKMYQMQENPLLEVRVNGGGVEWKLTRVT